MKLKPAAALAALWLIPAASAGESRSIAIVSAGGAPVSAAALEAGLEGGVKVSAVSAPLPEAGEAILRLAREGAGLIFSPSPEAAELARRLARRLPGVKLEQAGAGPFADNLARFTPRLWEARYISGLIAGKTTSSGVIGFVATAPEPQVIGEINAACIAARSVNPGAMVSVYYVNAAGDAEAEASAVESLISEGADVFLYNTGAGAAAKAAEAAGMKVIGQGKAAAEQVAPQRLLTSVLLDWSPWFVRRAKAFLNGEWSAGVKSAGLAEGVISFAPYAPSLPKDVIALAEYARLGMYLGKLWPFTGPLKRQDGSEWLQAGQAAAAKAPETMDFYVDCVKSAMPGSEGP